MKKEIEELSKDECNGMFTLATYSVIIMSESVYTYAKETYDLIKASPFFKQRVKEHANKIFKGLNEYRSRMQSIFQEDLGIYLDFIDEYEDVIKTNILHVYNAIYREIAKGRVDNVAIIAKAYTLDAFLSLLRSTAKLRCEEMRKLPVKMDKGHHFSPEAMVQSFMMPDVAHSAKELADELYKQYGNHKGKPNVNLNTKDVYLAMDIFEKRCCNGDILVDVMRKSGILQD